MKAIYAQENSWGFTLLDRLVGFLLLLILFIPYQVIELLGHLGKERHICCIFLLSRGV